MTAVVEARELRRDFGRRAAVDGVSLALDAGACLALFGPNGAGKTTLLRLLAGLLRATSGSARVGGVALPGGGDARARVGLISHETMLYGALSALENVEFTARLYGVRGPQAAARRALARLQVADRADASVHSLSRGLQQRVSIARAIVHEPSVLLLDEPYTGLDAAGARALSAALAELMVGGAAMVLVTHNLGEGLAVATEAAVMVRGRFVRYDARSAIEATTYATAYGTLAAGAA